MLAAKSSARAGRPLADGERNVVVEVIVIIIVARRRFAGRRADARAHVRALSLPFSAALASVEASAASAHSPPSVVRVVSRRAPARAHHFHPLPLPPPLLLPTYHSCGRTRALGFCALGLPSWQVVYRGVAFATTSSICSREAARVIMRQRWAAQLTVAAAVATAIVPTAGARDQRPHHSPAAQATWSWAAAFRRARARKRAEDAAHARKISSKFRNTPDISPERYDRLAGDLTGANFTDATLSFVNLGAARSGAPMQRALRRRQPHARQRPSQPVHQRDVLLRVPRGRALPRRDARRRRLRGRVAAAR